MAEVPIQQAIRIALEHYQAGRLAESESVCRKLLQHDANLTDGLQLLGAILGQTGRLDEAVELLRRAVALHPGNPAAHNNLGNALRGKGQLDEAIAAYRQSIALRPDYAPTHENLGSTLLRAGRLDEAVAAFRQVIFLKPDLPGAHKNLGCALQAGGQWDDAIAEYRQAPKDPVAQNNLGIVWKEKGQLDESIACYRQAIALQPNYAEAYSNLGNALVKKRRFDEAIAACGQAVTCRPDLAEAHCNFANALIAIGRLDEAIAACQKAVAIKPDFAEAYNNLGTALKDTGQLDDAIVAYRRAIALKPDYHEAHSNLVFILNYHPGYTAQTIAEELGLWDRQQAKPLEKFIQPHANNRDPKRRLRIGYLSPDLRMHVVGRFLLPLLAHHDKSQVEVFGYAQVFAPDGMTERLRSCTDHWRSIIGLSDAQTAELIRQDQIDILVDLALHTAQNRLLIYARKPAPVQVTYAGYPGSTGLSTIDYRLTDPYLDPPGLNDAFYSEQSIRLPHSFWCYDPMTELPIDPLPAEGNDYITFGCLNHSCKINPGIVKLWAAVLRNVNRSRMLLLCSEGSHRQRVFDLLKQEGVDSNRIEMVSRRPRDRYLELYHGIDLGLDTFPYNGHTTSLDSLWMGVPVVSLSGQTAVSRAGLSQCANLGLTELVASYQDDFVQIATSLARDVPRLAELRRTLRDRMQSSPLMDAVGSTRAIESAYRQMWTAWCRA